MSELNRYKIDVAALQETKWFGDETYRVGNSTVLTVGRKIPDSDELRVRGEGVALVLSSKAKDAWNEGGTKWIAWSSRLIVATLSTGRQKNDRLHVLSCYAPTFALV